MVTSGCSGSRPHLPIPVAPKEREETSFCHKVSRNVFLCFMGSVPIPKPITLVQGQEVKNTLTCTKSHSQEAVVSQRICDGVDADQEVEEHFMVYHFAVSSSPIRKASDIRDGCSS